jgi:hypothetical protein
MQAMLYRIVLMELAVLTARIPGMSQVLLRQDGRPAKRGKASTGSSEALHIDMLDGLKQGLAMTGRCGGAEALFGTRLGGCNRLFCRTMVNQSILLAILFGGDRHNRGIDKPPST